jgi:transposase-like protein
VTVASIAGDLGVNPGALRSWVRLDDERRGGGPGAGAEAPGTVELENAGLRRRSVSWRRNATSCVRRPGNSRGRRGSPATLRTPLAAPGSGGHAAHDGTYGGRVITTIAEPSAAKAPDLIGRDFTARADQ